MGTQSTTVDDGLSPQERFERWRDLVGRTRVAEATSAHGDTFTAGLRLSHLGPVMLMATSFPSARFRRSERMIRTSDQELYHLTLLTAGNHLLARGRDQAVASGVGDLSLIDSSHPYDGRFFGLPSTAHEEPRVAGISIDLPISSFPVPPDRLRDLLGRRLTAREGTGAVLADFLLSLDRQAASLKPAEASRLGALVVDLTAAWVARELDDDDVLPEEARQRAVVESVRAFIRRNLHDPDLTPPVAAAAHHVSVGHLHRLFTRHSHGQTVAAYIRSQRMAKAHRDLADPALRALPIHVVAARCGLLRASDFGRAFKAAYGLTPREHRRGAPSGPAAEATESAESATQ
ncbi:AraC family transcriptional regulator [Kitasatospora sp. NPDC089797]|uniref:AraC family transcriptional regulator n=1 Tax=Kitasatospora sp. NPDC089797 TaxID=3155298 RepID=UPI00344871AD